ncbi:MAG: effector binding domain-containing protein [Cyclobacteriaceae bacterium]
MIIEKTSIIGIALKTTNANAQAASDIPTLWQRFLSEAVAARIPNKLDDRIFSVYTDYEGDYTQPYTLLLGCAVPTLDNIPKGMIGKTFPTGAYQHFIAAGNLAEGIVYQVWERIWNSDISRAYTADYEIYGEKAQNSENAEVDIYIALQ